MKNLEDYIYVVPNVISSGEINQVKTLIENSDLWKPMYLKGGLIAKEDTPNCDILFLSYLADKPDEFMDLDPILFHAVSKALREYRDKVSDKFSITIDTGYEAVRYTENGFYATHTDGVPHRVLTCSIALNDDYEGGELAFWGEELKIKVPTGSAIIFPSNFMYPYQTLPITKGTRYSVDTWFS